MHADGRRRWLLVSKATDLERALAVRAFKITRKQHGFDEAEHTIAFAIDKKAQRAGAALAHGLAAADGAAEGDEDGGGTEIAEGEREE
eukprot:5177377-Prymnesium_polylepis.1